MAIITRPKIWFSILCLSMFIYAAYPFANGFGCDFTADLDDELRDVHVKCFAGKITQVYHSKTTGKVFVTESVYGKRGDTVFMVPFSGQYHHGTIAGGNASQLTDYVHPSKIMSFKLFESDVDDDDIILWDEPVMKIYKIKRVGKLSYF